MYCEFREHPSSSVDGGIRVVNIEMDGLYHPFRCSLNTALVGTQKSVIHVIVSYDVRQKDARSTLVTMDPCNSPDGSLYNNATYVTLNPRP